MKHKIFTFIFSILLTHSLHARTQDVETYTIEKILSVNIDSSINPASFNYLETAYERAEKEGFQAVLIKLNTPGGLVTTTKDILTSMGKRKIPTFIWIYPEGSSASSAGAIIASGAHVLGMCSGSNIGAATPVQLGKDLGDSDLRKKAINDLVALVKSLSSLRGRNTTLFGKMVEEAASFESQEALDKHLIDFLADSEKEFLEKANNLEIHILGHSYKLEITADTKFLEFEMDIGQRLLNILASPNLAYILFILGAALLYFEFQTTGFVAGSIGAICLVLAGIGFQVLPLNFGALGLIILAFVMFLLESYITSHGLLSVAGLTSLIIGSLFIFRTDQAYIEMSKTLLFSSFAAATIFVFLMLFFMMKERRLKSIPEDYYSLVGKEGFIVSVLPQQDGFYHYQIKIGGEIWQAKSHKEHKVGDVCKIKEDAQDLILKI